MINLDICSVSLDTHIDLTDTEREGRERPNIRFDVFPAEYEYIELETGEVFGDGVRGKQRDEDTIECQVILYVSSEQREPDLCYHESVGSEDDFTGSSLAIHIPLLPLELDFILKNIQSGIFPVAMTIDYQTNYFSVDDGDGGRKEPENIITYGWEPDGSHLIWKNSKKENQRVKLTTVSFSYSPLPAKRNEESYRLEIPKVQNYLEMISSELGLLHQNIESSFEKLRRGSMYCLIAAATVALVLYLK